jgi:hypothetical protein
MTEAELSNVVAVNMDSSAVIAEQAGQWFGRASMKVRSGVVVLVYREGSHHAVNDGELHIRFSEDYGTTWTAEDTFTNGSPVTGFPMNPSTLTAGEDAGEPWLYLADNGNLVLHMWRVDYNVTTNGTYQSVSTDGGATWSSSAAVDFTGIADDSKVFATDDDFVVSGTIYAGARIYTDADGTPSESILIKSTDNGATWEKVSTICGSSEGAAGTGAWEVALEYLGSNTIIALLRMADYARAYKRVSSDMGATWGSLTEITSTVGIMGRTRVYTRAHLKGEANWWDDETLIMVGYVHQTSGSSTPRRNCIWVSRDAGTTWTLPIYIDASTEDAGYGDIIWNPTTKKYIVVNYQGTQAEADLMRYTVRIFGI